MARPKKDAQKEKARQEAREQRIKDEKEKRKALEAEEKEKQEKKSKRNLKDRVDDLENLVLRIAHQTGCNRLCIEACYEPWTPGKRDMTKYKNEVKDEK